MSWPYWQAHVSFMYKYKCKNRGDFLISVGQPVFVFDLFDLCLFPFPCTLVLGLQFDEWECRQPPPITTMVDMETHYHPPSPLEDSVLGSPLCADDDFMGSMEQLQEISQSISDDALSSFGVPKYQSSSNGSDGSTVLGKIKCDFFLFTKLQSDHEWFAFSLWFHNVPAPQCNLLAILVVVKPGVLQFSPVIPILLQIEV